MHLCATVAHHVSLGMVFPTHGMLLGRKEFGVSGLGVLKQWRVLIGLSTLWGQKSRQAHQGGYGVEMEGFPEAISRVERDFGLKLCSTRLRKTPCLSLASFTVHTEKLFMAKAHPECHNLLFLRDLLFNVFKSTGTTSRRWTDSPRVPYLSLCSKAEV